MQRTLLAIMALLLAPIPGLPVERVAVPEYWSFSDSLTFFALAGAAFGLIAGLKLLRLNSLKDLK